MSKVNVPKECRFCGQLKLIGETLPAREELLPGEENRYRCSVGRLDSEIQGGIMIPNSWAWSTIIRPGRAVAAAQKDCPTFRVSPDLANVYPRLAKKFGFEPPVPGGKES